MIFYTDGSAHPNPGPGGFGVVIVNKDDSFITYSEQYKHTTNNEMEMRAILWAAAYAYTHNTGALIYSDSSYAINTFTKWMYNWHDNGWIKSDGQVPQNLELVKAFYELSKICNIRFEKVKGHVGNKYNEIADLLATGRYKNNV